MSSIFYASIISDKEQGIEISALKKAARDISTYYRTSSTKQNLTPPDYNDPAYRCAYLYKYASLHSAMANKYFRKMLRKQEVKNTLYFNKNIKICCLGGGPGTEIVGIFKALALFPTFHKRVAKVSVLDVCQGWEDSFKNIMSNLIKGKDKKVPNTFISRRKFKEEFIQVDLQDSLPVKVRKVISEADVVCMMKFVSELPTERSRCVLKVLGKLLKNKALILYIDNSKGDSSKSICYISRLPAFKVVLGPIDDAKFSRQTSISDIATYGCKPQTHATISVIGWIKTSERSNGYDASLSTNYSSLTVGTKSETKDSDILANLENEVCNKYTQTEQEIFKLVAQKELAALLEELTHLLTVIEKLTLKKKTQEEKS